MSFPFYQGNVNDLLNIAGAGQGSFLLGQLMKAQQDKQKADLEQTLLANLAKQQEMKQKEQEFPLVLDDRRAGIDQKRANTGMTQEQIKAAQRETDIFQAEGGVETAVNRRRTKDDVESAKALDSLREAYEDYVLSMDHSGPNMVQDITELGRVTKIPEFVVRQMAQAAQSPESWKEFQNRIYSNSKKGREAAAKAQEARDTAMRVEKERTDRAIRVAEIKAASALNHAKNQKFEEAARDMIMAAEAARDAGDEARAKKYEDMANKFVALDKARIEANARARAEGRIDPGATIEQGRPVTRQPAPPVQPYPNRGAPPGSPVPPGAVRPRQTP